MARRTNEAIGKILEAFSLDTLQPPVDLTSLATEWGVVSVEHREISSDAMLIPTGSGFKVVLKEAASDGEKARQRFSFAHELAHLLLQITGYDDKFKSSPKYRRHNGRNYEERLCDQIAAEILMPRPAFIEDADNMGWSLDNLGPLARRYETSIPATARRMVDLTAETCNMSIWKPALHHDKHHSLQQSFSANDRYGVPNSTGLPRRRLWLVGRAASGREVESGFAPLVDKKHPRAFPADVPAEAWAWGWNEHRRVVVFYYPDRNLTGDMGILSKATGMG